MSGRRAGRRRTASNALSTLETAAAREPAHAPPQRRTTSPSRRSCPAGHRVEQPRGRSRHKHAHALSCAAAAEQTACPWCAVAAHRRRARSIVRRGQTSGGEEAGGQPFPRAIRGGRGHPRRQACAGSAGVPSCCNEQADSLNTSRSQPPQRPACPAGGGSDERRPLNPQCSRWAGPSSHLCMSFSGRDRLCSPSDGTDTLKATGAVILSTLSHYSESAAALVR